MIRCVVFLIGSVLLGCFAGAQPAHATSMERLSLSELTWVADLIVEARVESNQAERLEGSVFLRTVTTLVLERVHKGAPMEGDRIDVLTLGGVLGSEETAVPSAPIYTPGERVLLFLEEREGGLRAVGLSQGKLTLVEEPDTGLDALVRVAVPRGLLSFEERGVKLPAQPTYARDLIGQVEDDLRSEFVPVYRGIAGVPAAKDARFRAAAVSAGQTVDPRWTERDKELGR